MTRYRIIYNKTGYPLSTWTTTLDDAKSKADMLRAVGYSVTVWEDTLTGTRQIDL